MRALVWLSAAAIGGLAACNTDAPLPNEPRVCFRASEVTDWGGKQALLFYVRTHRGDVFEGRLRDVCPEVDFTHKIAIQPTLGAQRVCPGQGAMLTMEHPSGRAERCAVEDFRLLTPAEAQTLPANLRPGAVVQRP